MMTERNTTITAYTAQSDSESGGVVSTTYWLTEYQAIANCPQIELEGETVSTTKWQIELPQALLGEISENGLHYRRIYEFCEPKIMRD